MRSFDSDVLASLQNASGQERVFLIKLDFSSGSLYLSTGSRDLDWDSQTWTAIGGGLQIGGIEESGDLKGQGIDIVLSGVDLSIISTLLSQKYRGRTIQVWQAILDQSTGLVLDAIDLFDGLQLDSYTVEEKITRGAPLTAIIRTRGRHRLAAKEFRGIRANVHGHQQYYTDDTFYAHTASLGNRKLYWGTTAPVQISSGGGGFIPGDDEDDRGRKSRVQ